MRRNLYSKKTDTFIVALGNLGWLKGYHDSNEQHFRKGTMHLILKTHKAGDYCVMHIDRYLAGRIHRHSVTKSDELVCEFYRVMAEYKRLRS